jgi:hypothetical protein
MHQHDLNIAHKCKSLQNDLGGSQIHEKHEEGIAWNITSKLLLPNGFDSTGDGEASSILCMLLRWSFEAVPIALGRLVSPMAPVRTDWPWCPDGVQKP